MYNCHNYGNRLGLICTGHPTNRMSITGNNSKEGTSNNNKDNGGGTKEGIDLLSTAHIQKL